LALYTNGNTEVKTESNGSLPDSRQTRGKHATVSTTTRITRSSGPNKRMRMNSVYDKDTPDSGDEATNGSCKDEVTNDSSDDTEQVPVEPQISSYWKNGKSENGTDTTTTTTNGLSTLRSSARSNNPFIKPQQNDSRKVASKVAVTQTQKASATAPANINGFKKHLSLSRKPVCLIAKNKVYETDPNVTITVRSK